MLIAFTHLLLHWGIPVWPCISGDGGGQEKAGAWQRSSHRNRVSCCCQGKMILLSLNVIFKLMHLVVMLKVNVSLSSLQALRTVLVWRSWGRWLTTMTATRMRVSTEYTISRNLGFSKPQVLCNIYLIMLSPPQRTAARMKTACRPAKDWRLRLQQMRLPRCPIRSSVSQSVPGFGLHWRFLPAEQLEYIFRLSAIFWDQLVSLLRQWKVKVCDRTAKCHKIFARTYTGPCLRNYISERPYWSKWAKHSCCDLSS